MYLGGGGGGIRWDPLWLKQSLAGGSAGGVLSLPGRERFLRGLLDFKKHCSSLRNGRIFFKFFFQKPKSEETYFHCGFR